MNATYTNYARLRDTKGLTDYKVCKDTGIARSTMSDWKRGVYTPKLDKIMRIADFFEVPLDELLGE